ncbi:hypothetical protein MKX42_10075 [Paenibacillus sp. FSL R7-0204]
MKGDQSCSYMGFRMGKDMYLIISAVDLAMRELKEIFIKVRCFE